MAIGDELLVGFDPESAAGLGTSYDVWLRNALGGSPLAYGYGQRMAPWQQLQYLSQPAGSTTGDFNRFEGIANPFMSWLGGTGTGAVNNPLTSAQWMQRGADVTGALGAGTAAEGATPAQLQIMERFGGANEAAEARQRALAFAPIMSGTSSALRGEMGNVLNRMYENWLVGSSPEGQSQPLGGAQSFLDYAQVKAEADKKGGLWSRFGMPGYALSN